MRIPETQHDGLAAPSASRHQRCAGGRVSQRSAVNGDLSRTRTDFTRSKPLIAAIAHELWKLHGGNDVLNWLEAEILLQNALADDDASDAEAAADEHQEWRRRS